MSSLADALRSSDGFGALAQALPDALLVVRPSGDVAYASDQAADVLDRPAGEIVDRPFLDLVDERDRHAFPDPMETTMMGTRDFRSADAPGRWLNAAFVPPSFYGDRADAIHPDLGECTLAFVRGLPGETGLRDRTDLFRTALDAANNLIVVTDPTVPDNPLVFVNEYFLEVTGYSRDEVIGQNCRFLQTRPDGTRDDDQDAVRELARAVEAGEATQVVLRNYRKSGELFYNELFITPVRDPEGRLVHFVGVQNNVTERVRARQDAVENEGLFRAFFDGTPLLMGVVEPDRDALDQDTLRVVAANDRAADVFGLEPGGALEPGGRELAELGFTAGERERWRRAVDACAEEGETVSFDTVHPWDTSPTDDGARHLRVTVGRIAGAPSGGPLYSFIGEDTTDQRRGERQRRLLSAAVEQAAEAIVVTDAEVDPPGPRILYANRAHERIFGYPVAEVIGRSPRMYQGPATDRVALDRIRAALRAGEPVETETVNYRKDGTPFVLRWEIAPVRDPAGRIVNWVGTQRDVTERRRLEAEVLEIAAMEQERIARDLHDGLGQVMTGASFVVEALRAQLAAAGHDALAADAERAGELIGQALSQARAIARGLSPIDVEPTGLMTALAGLAGDAEAAHGLSATFTYDAPALVRSRENAADLYRIAQEALSNAARHAKAETVRIAIAHRDEGVVLSVRDDGRGIAPDALDGGRGLGLRSMRARAERLGGTLAIEPAEGGGTRVSVTFPRAYEASAPVAEVSAAEKPA